MTDQSLTLNTTGFAGSHAALHGQPRTVQAQAASRARVSRASSGGAHFKPAGSTAPTAKAQKPLPFAPKKDDGSEGEPPRREGRTKAPLIVIAVIAALYLVGVITFSMVFMPGTSINGQDVSLKTPSAVAQDYTAASSSYALAASGDGIDLTIGIADIDLNFNYDQALSTVDQGTAPLEWPVKVFTGNDLTVNFSPSFDEAKLEALVQPAVDQVNANATQPTNATIAYNGDTKAFAVAPEQYGTAVDAQATLATIKEALDSSLTQVTLGQESLVAPTVFRDNPSLKTAMDTANGMLGASQTLTVNGSESTTVGADQISAWIFLDENLTPQVSGDAVKQWVNDTYAPSVNTVGIARTFTTPYGKQVTVEGGTYGWTVDADSLAQSLVTNIQSATAGTIEVPFSTQGGSYNPGGADWGSRYIDVDLTDQHARMYDENGSLIWESDLVSGDVTENHGTPEGVYTINNHKGKNQTLRGLDYNHDGEPDYVSHVTYWMPFVENLVAFHDAPWRGRFGGSVYKGNGSHGCVNLPASAAKQLYNLTQVGDVVVVHS